MMDLRSIGRAPLAGAAALLLSAAPNARAAAPSAAPSTTLTIFAAASLKEAFGEIGKQFEQAHRGVTVRFNFAGSQQLAAQLREVPVGDVFASADQRWMDDVRAGALIASEPRPFAHNRLVVIVPRTNPARIDRLQDIARRGVKVVIAAEAVPAGAYCRQAVAKLSAAPGFEADYARRVLENVVSQEENVRAVVAKVQIGEADAGFVYRSDVTPAVARVVRVIEIPDPYNVLATYPIATLKASARPDLAAAFVDRVLSPAGQAVLARNGLIPVSTGSP